MKPNHFKEQKLVFADPSIAEAVFAILANGRSIGDYTFASKSADSHEDIYFDTPASGLQRTRASLRLRRLPNGSGVLQFKKPVGDVAVDMEYVTLACEHAWADSTMTVAPDDQINTAILLQAGGTEVVRTGVVKTERRVLLVTKGTREVAEICLDRFSVSQAGGAKPLETSEIEIKGSSQLDLLHLGESLANWFGLIRVTSSKLERHIPLQRPAERLLLDMDPGVDDALALLYLFAQPDGPKVEAITIVGGNVGVRQCAQNAHRICRWAQERGLISEIPPIGTGVDLSHGRSNAASVHGSDGLGDVEWGALDEGAESRAYADAAELQRAVLLGNPDRVTVVATGPCSNLAKLIHCHPEVLAAAREVIIMAGSFFDCGNRGPKAEFNIHSDSAAARTVLDYCRQLVPNGPKAFRELVPLSFVGLDVTHRVMLERKMLKVSASPIAELAGRISSKYMDFYRTVLGVDGCPLHDPLAMGLALHPEYLVREPYHVEIVSTPEVMDTDGITIADHRPCARFKNRLKEVTQVGVSVNVEAFLSHFLQSMRRFL